RFHRRLVRFVAANEKQTAVDFRVERFNAAVEHFGKARVFADVLHREAGFAQCFGRAAGGNQFDARRGESLREWHQAGLVGNGKQRPLNLCHRRTKSTRDTNAVNRQISVTSGRWLYFAAGGCIMSAPMARSSLARAAS